MRRLRKRQKVKRPEQSRAPVVVAGANFRKHFLHINRVQVMVITVKKQVEEIVEVATSSYYKDNYSHHYINDKGILMTVRKTQITVWDPSSCQYDNSIQEVITKAEPSNQSEFDNAYAVAMNTISAVLRDDETVNHF